MIEFYSSYDKAIEKIRRILKDGEFHKLGVIKKEVIIDGKEETMQVILNDKTDDNNSN